MANKGIGATFRISTGEKYSVDRDGMINVKTKLGDTETEYKNLRLIGMNVLGDAIRAVMEKGGITEIATANIIAVEDANPVDITKGQFSCIKKV